MLQRPRESTQYTSGDFADALQSHDILASVGTTGDAYDNAMAESFVDTLKTELIADRRFRSRAQLELTLVKWVGWYNNQRLHEALGDIPPAELTRIFFTQLSIVGSTMGTRDQLGRLLRFCEQTGTRPLIDRVLPLADAAQGFAAMIEGAHAGKLVFVP